MPSLNDEVLHVALSILEQYRSQLFDDHHFNVDMFEHELRECWGVGYRTIKDFVIDLAGHGRFQEVAAYYMEHSNAPGVVAEFKPVLAGLYGVKSFHYSPDKELKREQFWRRAFGENLPDVPD